MRKKSNKRKMSAKSKNVKLDWDKIFSYLIHFPQFESLTEGLSGQNTFASWQQNNRALIDDVVSKNTYVVSIHKNAYQKLIDECADRDLPVALTDQLLTAAARSYDFENKMDTAGYFKAPDKKKRDRLLKRLDKAAALLQSHHNLDDVCMGLIRGNSNSAHVKMKTGPHNYYYKKYALLDIFSLLHVCGQFTIVKACDIINKAMICFGFLPDAVRTDHLETTIKRAGYDFLKEIPTLRSES